MNVNGICFTLGVILLLYRRGDSDVSAVTDKNSYPENRNPQVQRNNVRVRKIIEAKSSSSEIAERTDRDSEISGQYILVYRTNVTNVALKTRHLPQRLNCWKNLRNTASNTTTPISLLFSFAQKKFKESVISGVFPDMLDDLTSDEDILIIEPVRKWKCYQLPSLIKCPS